MGLFTKSGNGFLGLGKVFGNANNTSIITSGLALLGNKEAQERVDTKEANMDRFQQAQIDKDTQKIDARLQKAIVRNETRQVAYQNGIDPLAAGFGAVAAGAGAVSDIVRTAINPLSTPTGGGLGGILNNVLGNSEDPNKNNWLPIAGFGLLALLGIIFFTNKNKR